MSLTWTFGELESTLARLHTVAEPARTKFQARLKNFHKLDFPAGFGRGRGIANRYEPQDVFLLNMAAHLTRLGVAPKRTVLLLKENMAAIMEAVAIATWDWMPTLYDTACREEDLTFMTRLLEGFSVYGVFDPLAMADLMDPRSVDDSEGWFQHRGPADFTEVLSGWLSTNGYISVVNISEVLYRSAYVSLVREDGDMFEFLRAVRAWALNSEWPTIPRATWYPTHPPGPDRTRQWLLWYNAHAFGYEYMKGLPSERADAAMTIYRGLSPLMRSYLRRENVDAAKAAALRDEAVALGLVSEVSLRMSVAPWIMRKNEGADDGPAPFPDLTLLGSVVQSCCFGWRPKNARKETSDGDDN